MMFTADAAFALELLALTAGAFLLVKSRKENAPIRPFIKFISYFVILASFLGMLCTSYFTVRYWMHGYFMPASQRWHQYCPIWQQDSNVQQKVESKTTKPRNWHREPDDHMMKDDHMQNHMMNYDND